MEVGGLRWKWKRKGFEMKSGEKGRECVRGGLGAIGSGCLR